MRRSSISKMSWSYRLRELPNSRDQVQAIKKLYSPTMKILIINASNSVKELTA
jgi:hypothetical protein